MKSKVNETSWRSSLTVAWADRSPAVFHRSSFYRWAPPARCPSPTFRSDPADSPADCCCYCYSALSACHQLKPKLTANGYCAVALLVAVVTVGARFPIHLIVRLACPNPNEFHRCVCAWEGRDRIRGREKETETGESREKFINHRRSVHQNTKG
jgi:hypothetical protein